MCFLLVLAAIGPRFALFVTWLFTGRIGHAIQHNFVAFLGFLFFPWTTFFYVLAWAPLTHVSGIGWLLVIFGFVLDLGSYGGSGAYSRSRNRR